MADRPQPGMRAMLAGDAPHLALEIHAILVEIRALRVNWETEAREGFRNPPLEASRNGYALALDRCAQALKALEDGHG